MSHSYVIRPSGVTTSPSRPTIPSSAASTCPPNAIAPAVYPVIRGMRPPTRTQPPSNAPRETDQPGVWTALAVGRTRLNSERGPAQRERIYVARADTQPTGWPLSSGGFAAAIVGRRGGREEHAARRATTVGGG